MIELVEVLEIVITILATSFSTAFATTLAQYYRQRQSERKNMYMGFVKEIRQNIQFADHNVEKLKDKATRLELLTFRDDFWKMSLSGYLLELSPFLQKLLYQIYMKQYVIGERLVMLRAEAKDTKGRGLEGSWEKQRLVLSLIKSRN